MRQVAFEKTKTPFRVTVESIGYYENVDEIVSTILDFLELEGCVSVRVECEEMGQGVVVNSKREAA